MGAPVPAVPVPAAPVPAAPASAASAPRVVAPAGVGPAPVPALPAGARVVDLRPGAPGHVPFAGLGAFARGLPDGAAVVVRAADPERAAAAAERLAALGLAATWLAEDAA